jgi:catechol-2,3-dioxygenase
MHPSTNQARVSPFHLRVSSSAAARKISRKVLLLSQKRREKNALKISSSAYIHITLTRANEKRSETRSRRIQRFPLLAKTSKKKKTASI